MLRFEITGPGKAVLPAVDLDTGTILIGCDASAHIRLPAQVARPLHIRIEGQTWILLAESVVGGMTRSAGDSGSVGHGIVVELGAFRVRVLMPPAGTPASPPHRTDSLARELARIQLGDDAEPSLVIERGPGAGARRSLVAEEDLVIGSGDAAQWVLADADLAPAHVEVRRGWDGVTVVDLGSRTGSKLDGRKVGAEPVELCDGATLSLGRVALRFHDPAEAHLRGGTPSGVPLRATRSGSLRVTRSGALPTTDPGVPWWPVVLYAALGLVALAGLLWFLAT